MKYPAFRHGIVASAALLACLPALSQTAAAPVETLDVVEVVGTINKLPNDPLFRQAKSATQVDSSVLKTQGVGKMDEVARYQAGMTAQVFGNDTNTNWFRIRGTEASQAVDGAPMPTYGFFTPHVDTYGVEAVEIEKGANAMAFGAANAGGLINYVSKRPDRSKVNHGEVVAQVGNNGQYGLAGDFTGTLAANDDVRYRLVGSVKRANGEWNGTKDQSYYFAPSLAVDFTPDTKLTVLASMQKDKGVPSSNFLPQSGTLVATDRGFIDRKANLGDPTQDTETNRSRSIGYEFSHKFSDTLSFSQNYRYQHVKNHHRGAYAYPAAYNADWSAAPLRAANGYSVGRGVVFNDGTAKSHTLDNRLTWKFRNEHVNNTLTAGVDYRHDKVDARYTLFGSAAPVNVFDPAASYGSAFSINAPQTGITAKQLGMYVQNHARVLNKVGITAGVRYDRARSNETAGQSVKSNHTSLSGSVMYYGPAGVNPYVSYSEAFRLPTGLGGDGRLYSPYTTKQIEVGVKYMPTWSESMVSLSAFRAKDKGALVSKDLGATVSSEDDIIRKGVELQANTQIGNHLTGQFAYTYLSSVTDNANKTQQPLTPKHSASLRAMYDFDQGVLKGLSLGGGVRYVGKSYTSSGSLYSGAQVPSSTLVDLVARYSYGKNWEAQLNVNNLTNRRYLSGCDYYCYYGAGRSVVGKVTYKF